MAIKCAICSKTTRSGNSVSHSHHKTKRQFKPNLQRINFSIDGKKKKDYVCTRCLRSQKVVKAA